jgi:peroxiredoxin
VFVSGLLMMSMMLSFSCCVAVDEAPVVGAQAPGFNLLTIDGDTVSLEGLRGKPVVLTFWTTGCGWCLYQMPFFQVAYEEKGQEVEIVAIDIAESSSTVRQFAEYFGYTFTFALDLDRSVSNEYNLRGTPTNFYIDGDGVIRSIKIGAFIDEDELYTWLDSF